MMSAGQKFRALLAAPGLLTLPGVYDGISARLAEKAGFSALYMTGYGVAASAFGLPDAGLVSGSEMLDRVRMLAGAVSLPFIADGDTGYGGLLNVDRTVRLYARAGAAGIQIEDQEFPKKCGHTPHRRVVAAADAERRVRVAACARPDRDFLIVARTDAAGVLGLDEALRRGERFLEAGADILFIESPESLEDLRRVGETFRGVPLLANMVEGGRTPVLAAADLQGLGFKIALYPATGFLAAALALAGAYRTLAETGSSQGAALYSFAAMNALMGFPAVYDFEKTWSETEDKR
ncbi:MAG: isocitrate lyase/PEP mutase family protein [Acidibrevibacterium sp.]|uniref:isocitrate lyase/PEP mutase family protein n=1 Tax=Acidibrevibacterium sp. TaxID=2606776 RepID=UPI003D089D11